MRFAKKPLVAIAAVSVVLGGCGIKHPAGGFYTKVGIGQSETITPEGERTAVEPDAPAFFLYARGSFIGTVEHFARSAVNSPPHKVFYMEFNLADDHLDRTVKTIQLFSGDFGNVSLQKTCFYNRSFHSNLDTVSVGRLDVEGSPPGRSLPLPAATQRAPTSFALVRAYRDGVGTAVVVGDYEANGRLGSLHVDHTRSGHRLFYPEDGVYMNPLGPNSVAAMPKPERIGIPAHLDQQHAISSVPATERPVDIEILFTIYADGAFIREDILKESDKQVAVAETRYMQASALDEQRQLEPACNAQLGRQRALSNRTVE